MIWKGVWNEDDVRSRAKVCPTSSSCQGMLRVDSKTVFPNIKVSFFVFTTVPVPQRIH